MQRAARVLELLGQRLPLRPRPDAPAVHAEVVGAELERLGWGAGEILQAADVLVFQESEQIRVLAAVGHRVEVQERRLMLRTEVAQADADSSRAARSAAHRDRPSRRAVALHGLVVRLGARLPKPHIVRVRIQHDDPQARLHQQLLQQHAERVGLPRT